MVSVGKILNLEGNFVFTASFGKFGISMFASQDTGATIFFQMGGGGGLNIWKYLSNIFVAPYWTSNK